MAYQPTILNGETVFRNEVFQTGLMSQLQAGTGANFDLCRTQLEVDHVAALNVLIIDKVLDGVCYQVRHDGSVSLPDLRQQTPYAVVTNFVPMIKRELPQNLLRKSASQILDDFTVSKNYMYAIKIYGEFEWVRTRTVIKQEKPYPKMVAATENEDIVQFDNVTGTIVGFRTPIYEQGISVPGCHAHFIDDEHVQGGHVVDFKLRSAKVEICPGTGLQLHLPLTPEFSSANLSPEDLADQISKAEKH
ncbi:acetolactate decarboxylase [Rothia mucilaginosa]|uniref:acetolactate decarboxylase n=1 Tax=Rothia mucilaginosa TaxID=43675 RepID=UPI0028E3FFF7|nr:acetolactate decarboxylase [Rothia mucilaginosa]